MQTVNWKEVPYRLKAGGGGAMVGRRGGVLQDRQWK